MKTTLKAQADHCHVGQDLTSLSLDFHGFTYRGTYSRKKYCSVVVELNESFYLDYRLENYFKRDSTAT